MKVLLVVALFLFAFGTFLAQAQPRPAGADSVKSNKLCPKCGVANFPDARFCYSCGAALEGGTVPEVLPESALAYTLRAGFCPVCGVMRYPEAKFCSRCGASFSDLLLAGLPRKIESGPKKDPGMAFAYSLLLPGAGQFYNGQTGKGRLYLGSCLVGLGLQIAVIARALEHVDSPPENARVWSQLGLVGFVVWGVSWVGSMIDAPAAAKAINHRRGYSARRTPGVGLVFVPDPRDPGHARPGVGLRAGF